MFATDIFSNIAYGRPGATQADVEQAASIANAHSFISTLPLGYRTQVGDKGGFSQPQTSPVPSVSPSLSKGHTQADKL